MATPATGAARKFIDCAEFPSEKNCTLKISGTEDEVLCRQRFSMPSPFMATLIHRASERAQKIAKGRTIGILIFGFWIGRCSLSFRDFFLSVGMKPKSEA